MTDIDQQERGQEPCGQKATGGVPLSSKVQEDEIDENLGSPSRDEETPDDTSAADNADVAVLQAGDMLLDYRQGPPGGGAPDPQETSQVNDSEGIQFQATGVGNSSIENDGEGENEDQNIDHTAGETTEDARKSPSGVNVPSGSPDHQNTPGVHGSAFIPPESGVDNSSPEIAEDEGENQDENDHTTFETKPSSSHIDEEIKEMHDELMSKLAEAMTEYGVFDDMKKLLQGGMHGLNIDEWREVNNSSDLLDHLERNESIKIDDYSTLIGVFWRIHQKAIIRLIETTQRKIHMKEYQKSIRRISTNHRGDAYDTKISKDGEKGILVIINQFTDARGGTMEDETRLTNLFLEFDFCVKPIRDISKKKLKQELKEIRKLIAEKKYPQLFLAMLSHGQKKGILTCEPSGEDEFITVRELTDVFKSRRCKELRGRPKVFLIEACRGEDEMLRFVFDVKKDDEGEEVERSMTPDQLNQSLVVSTPAESDVLICYSIFEGYKCVRSSSGSWFIQTLCKTVERNHKHSHFLEMMTMVNKDVSEKIMKSKDFPDVPEAAVGQMPCQLSTLTKDIYL